VTGGARHVAVLTGKRGGFGALAPTMREIAARGMRLSVLVTDQHLYERFGKTVREVEGRFEVAAAIDMGQEGDSNADRARAVGVCLTKAADVLDRLRPDFLLVIGDRGEVLATSIAAHNLRIAIAHIQGGDISGSLDEPVRHALTKLAHLHFPSTARAADRILRMGEEPWRVHTVGDTHIDQILLGAITPEAELRRRYQLPAGDAFIVVLQHSDSTEPGSSAAQMAETVHAVQALGKRALYVYPCSDQGYEGIIGEIEKLRGRPGVSIHENIPAPDFVGLQKIAGCLAGNSSAGLIEAPYFGLPAVNVGDRQIGREHAGNVLHVRYDRAAIEAAIRKALNDAAFREACRRVRPPFGDGTAYRRIADVLQRAELGPRLLNKRMAY
jgi:UDP-N-acetylglucosamine 2-epimerase (non-hydrolysing)/GDP/UDP-N,N'-diacetylbacillosamine 2-epimerase (hydrolysing)